MLAFVAPVFVVQWMGVVIAKSLGIPTEVPWMLLTALIIPFACFWVFWFSFRMMIPILISMVQRIGLLGFKLHNLSLEDAHDIMRHHRRIAFADFDRLKGRFRNYVR